ncbi:hypothetical protein Daus18300_009242 [Diaporthe australafricana]|uniref:MYND-type domain-containing protein n=1 Tax=Diaporthe australafricana TaxID=127596 RepID=A0ABR3WF02_9PEZI
MLTPTILNPVLPLYAVGNTPAVSLTRGVPQGVDADILLLGSGDVRHILYTAYHEKGFPTRRLDITSCDIKDAIIARNLLFLTFLVAQGESTDPQVSWNLYYHLVLDAQSASALQAHLVRILAVSQSLRDWRQSEFGDKFRFCDSSTLSSVHEIWTAYAESLARKDQNQYRADFETALKHSKNYKDATVGQQALVYGSFRAAAPLAPQVMATNELRLALDSWWEKGTVGPTVPANTSLPNPLFSVSLSEYSVLPYGGDPILSYHLAAACAHLTEDSPLRSGNRREGSSSLVEAAQLQFSEWSQAFIEMASRDLFLRFIAADGLSLCHTLQHHLETGQFSGHFYRRQLTMENLELDSVEYGSGSKTPSQFDVIDTSNLSDYLGTLNVLASSTPLLKAAPWATLYTETMNKGTEGEQKKFEELFCGPAKTISTLLGISPVEYWTNATAVSNVDEYMIAMSANEKSSQKPSIQWRFAWKFHEHLSGQIGSMRLRVKDEDLVTLIHNVYRSMFAGEDMMSLMSLSREHQTTMLQKQAYPKYHRGSLVAFIRMLLHSVDANQEVVCRETLKKITEDPSLVFGTNFSQELALEMSTQGLHTMPSLKGDIGPLFSTWSNIPEAVFITIKVPSVDWKKFAKVALESNVGFAVEGSLRCLQGSTLKWHNLFAAVQVAFGTASTTGTRGGEDFALTVEEDPTYCSGSSPIFASFPVPSAALQVDPGNTKVSLGLQNGAQNLTVFKELQLGGSVSGTSLTFYETGLEDNEVYITKHPPGQDGFPVYHNPRSPITQETAEDQRSHFTADIGLSGVITGITGHLDILSPEGKRLLSNKSTVDVRKISPFKFEVVLGEREAVYPLCFPVPVVKDGSKTRIARTSAYVEVIAPLADQATAQSLDDFIFPSTLAKPGPGLAHQQMIPVPLNIPHLNLDSLPVLDLSDKKRLGFLTTLVSCTFSVRERKLRNEANDSGIMATSARMNFKESIFTLFMLASGLQGGQTGLFAINHPEKGGIHMLIFVSAIRLDGANATAVLDAAVIPFTVDMIKKIEPFLLILRELECCTITVNDEELVLWKKVLPALVERCRNWTHAPKCEYSRPGATVPLSTEAGKQVLCGCGAGKLPDNFISLPEWDVASRFATRFAISPTYAVPFVEEVVDSTLDGSRSRSGVGVQGDQTLRCRNCGSLEAKGGGAPKKCVRCMKVRYCSVECQKKDWKTHRMECGEAGGKQSSVA